MRRTSASSAPAATSRSDRRLGAARTRGPLTTAAIGVTLLALAGGGVRATLSAIAENTTPTAITTGTLLLTLDDDGSGLTEPLADLAPGDVVDRFVDLASAGTLDAEDLTIALTTVGDAVLLLDGTGPSTTRALTLAVDACDTAWDTVASTCPGTTSVLLPATTLGDLEGTPAPLALTFAAGSTEHLRLRFTLPDQDETSVNGVPPSPSIQDAALEVTVTFRVEQRAATSTSD